MRQTFSEMVTLIKADYQRVIIDKKPNFLFQLLWGSSFSVTFWNRVSTYLKCQMGGRKSALFVIPFIISRIISRHYQFKYGVYIPVGLKVDGGFCIHHYSCIVIHQDAVIGKNFDIYQGVTVGRVREGSKAGIPTIGDNVMAFAGSKIIGNIHVGNNVTIGANSVVTSDVPDNAVVVGAPARIVCIKPID